MEPRFAGVPPATDWDFEKVAFEETGPHPARRRVPDAHDPLPQRPHGLRRAGGHVCRRHQGRLRARLPVPRSGHDNQRFSAYTCPPLTTVSQDCDEMGRVAVRMLLDNIANEDIAGEKPPGAAQRRAGAAQERLNGSSDPLSTCPPSGARSRRWSSRSACARRISPRRKTTMRSATSKMSRRLCEMKITPLPCAFSCWISDMTFSCSGTPRAAVGSSMITRRAFQNMARRSPPPGAGRRRRRRRAHRAG